MPNTNKRQNTLINALDQHGLPTTYLCFNILKLMFRENNRYFSINNLCALLAAKKVDVSLICDSLTNQDYIVKDLETSDQYKYNLHCRQEEKQCSFERYLAEVETNSIPIHEYLPYAPSAA